jgi:type II secretory pathway pseudopilin PulG
MRRVAARRGFALPAAIMALVLLSALVAGALFISTEELRAGRADLADQRALAAAEAALERAIVTWDTQRNTQLALGAVALIERRTLPNGDRIDVTATRTLRNGIWLTARATSGGDGRVSPARHTVSAAMRLVEADVPLTAALSAGGTVIVDNGRIDASPPGVANPASLVCPEIDAAAIGVLAPDTAQICGPMCSGIVPAGIVGSPAVAAGASLTSVLPSSGGARASIVLPGGDVVPRPSTAGGACDVGDPLNWGDPSGGACADRFPVIRITGDASLGTGATGQGVLLVDGSLRVTAGAHFDGVVIAANDIDVVGPDARITGAAIALDRDRAGASRVADGGLIRFARCAGRRAQLGAARLERTPGRWWAELR